MIKNDDLGKRIRTIREALGESQGAFAQKLGIGRVTLNRVENGVQRASRSTIEKFEVFIASVKGAA